MSWKLFYLGLIILMKSLATENIWTEELVWEGSAASSSTGNMWSNRDKTSFFVRVLARYPRTMLWIFVAFSDLTFPCCLSSLETKHNVDSFSSSFRTFLVDKYFVIEVKKCSLPGSFCSFQEIIFVSLFYHFYWSIKNNFFCHFESEIISSVSHNFVFLNARNYLKYILKIIKKFYIKFCSFKYTINIFKWLIFDWIWY